jgi:hypothetical protein
MLQLATAILPLFQEIKWAPVNLEDMNTCLGADGASVFTHLLFTSFLFQNKKNPLEGWTTEHMRQPALLQNMPHTKLLDPHKLSTDGLHIIGISRCGTPING